MATREVGVRLGLLPSGFKRGMADAVGHAKSAFHSLGASLSAGLSMGAKKGMDALKGIGSTLKSGLGHAQSFLGGIGVEDLLKGAISAEAGFRKLAFEVKAGKGVTVEWTKLQAEAQAAALKTGQSSAELGAVMSAVFAETGDIEFARASIETIATAATGAHQPLATMGAIAGSLNEKFGIQKKDLGEALATVVSLGNQGGVSVQDLGEKLGVIGAYAKGAGIEGAEGMKNLVGMLNLADNSGKNLKKNIGAVGGLVETLGTKGSRLKIMAQFGITGKAAESGDFQKNIGEILKKTGGKRDKLAVAIQGEQLDFIVDLGKTYAKAFEETKGDVKTKTAAGLAAYEDALKEAGKSNASYADIQNNASAEMETTERKMAVALEKLAQTFAKKEITEALSRLMGYLPKFADMVGDVVGFAIEHPKLAGAGALMSTGAGQGIMTMLGATIMGSFAKGGTEAGGYIAKAMSAVGPGLGSAIGLATAGIVLGEAAYQLKQAYDEHVLEKEKENRAEVSRQRAKGPTADDPWNMQLARDKEGNVLDEFMDRTTGEVRTAKSPWDVLSIIQERTQARVTTMGQTPKDNMVDDDVPMKRYGKSPASPTRGGQGGTGIPQPPRVQEVRVINPKEIGADGSVLRPIRPGAEG